MARPWVRRISRGAIAVAVIAVLALPVVLSETMTAIATKIAKVLPPLSLPLIVLLAVEATLVLLVSIWWLWWRLPKRQVRSLDIQIHDPKARADTEDNFRKTVGQALGGVAVLVGAVVAYLQFTQQQQQTAFQQIKASQDLLISNQVSKGFEQLSGEKMEMRFGGIYALEGVMNAPNSQYGAPVLEALCAFVRDHTATMGPPPARPMTDVQAVLTVIGRRNTDRLTAAAVAERVEGTMVLRLIRPKVDLSRANIPGAELIQAHLEGAGLSQAHLEGADLLWAHLEGAGLFAAYLGGAELIQAHLEGAGLSQAHLEGASLVEAHLEGAHLEEARGLTQAQIDVAFGDVATKLPEGLTRPARWAPASDGSAPAEPKPADLP